jgi:hypothetical protein
MYHRHFYKFSRIHVIALLMEKKAWAKPSLAFFVAAIFSFLISIILALFEICIYNDL